MGKVIHDFHQGEIFFKREVLEVLLPAFLAHSIIIKPNTDGKFQPFPARPVPFDVRFRIKNAWPNILDRLGERDTRGATALAADAGIPAPAFRRLIKDKVQFAMMVIHVSLRLAGVPDLKLLRILMRNPGRLDEWTTPIFARAVLHPPLASRMIPLLIYSRGTRGAWRPEKTAKVFNNVITALHMGQQARARNVLMRAGMDRVAARETLDNLARFAEFVLDAVLAYEPNLTAIKEALHGYRRLDQSLRRVYVEGAELKRELSKKDLRVINMTIDVCRAG